MRYPDGVRFAEDIELTAEEARIPKDRYLSREWLDLEVENVWKRMWQLVCREEELPGTGDFATFNGTTWQKVDNSGRILPLTTFISALGLLR